MARAEQMLQRALKVREMKFGPYHTFMLKVAKDLHRLDREQGRLDEAEDLTSRYSLAT